MEKMLASLATTALAAVNKVSGGDNKSATFNTTNNESNQSFKSVLNKQVSAQQSATQQTEAAKVNAKQALNAVSYKPLAQKADANQTKGPQDETPSTSVNKSSDEVDQVIVKSTSKADTDDTDANSNDTDAKSATDEMLALALFSQPLTATIKPDLPANAGELNAQLRGMTATKAENTAQLLSTDTAAKAVDGKAVTLSDANNVGFLQTNQVSDKVNLDKPDLLAENTHNTFATQLDTAKLQQELGADVLAKKADVELNTNLAAAIASAEKNIPMPATDTLNASQQVASRPVIDAYPGKAGWDQAISQRVIYMAGAGEQSATLTLNPPDLGPLQVVVSVNNGQADASFTSDNAEVRQALQDGMDNLREKMRESGVELGQTNVQSGEQSRQAFEQATQHRSSENRINATQSSAINATDIVSKKVAVKVLNGLVDTFA